jgi:hypothetical protein
VCLHPTITRTFSSYVFHLIEVDFWFVHCSRFRVLKEAKGMKTLRTKSEYATLCEFMDWLKEVKGRTDGVLLAFHDNNRDQVTPFLMDALMKYKLADQFFEIVSGFVNVCKYAEKHEETKKRSVALRTLCGRCKLKIENYLGGLEGHTYICLNLFLLKLGLCI